MAQHALAQCCIVWLSMAWHSTAWHGIAQHGTAWHSAAQRGTAWHSVAQHGTARHSIAQHGTARHSMAQHATHPALAMPQVVKEPCKGTAQGSLQQPRKGSSPGCWPQSTATCCRPASAARRLPGQQLPPSVCTLVLCCLLQAYRNHQVDTLPCSHICTSMTVSAAVTSHFAAGTSQ